MAQMFDGEVRLAIPAPTKIFTPAVTVILVLMILGFGMLSWVADFVRDYLVLYPFDVLRGRVWQLLTYSLINNGLGLIFNMLVVLFAGSAIEREWKSWAFLKLWVFTSVACAALWILLSFIFPTLRLGAFGSSPCVYGLLGAYALLFRRQKMLFFVWAMQAEHMVLLFIAIGLILAIASPANLIFIAGAGIAYLYVKFLWFLQKPKTRHAAPRTDRFKDLG